MSRIIIVALSAILCGCAAKKPAVAYLPYRTPTTHKIACDRYGYCSPLAGGVLVDSPRYHGMCYTDDADAPHPERNPDLRCEP